jgi:NADP oxidoreductase coenzyme F420-dependent
MTTIGLIGAGHIGGQVARLAIKNGYDVVISNSRGPETLSALVKELGPRARAATSHEAARAGDVVVVTIPLKNIRSVPVEPLAGKLVIDTNNYYPQRDGRIPELDDESTTTAELLQKHLPKSKVVKVMNMRALCLRARPVCVGCRAARVALEPAGQLRQQRAAEHQRQRHPQAPARLALHLRELLARAAQVLDRRRHPERKTLPSGVRAHRRATCGEAGGCGHARRAWRSHASGHGRRSQSVRGGRGVRAEVLLLSRA